MSIEIQQQISMASDYTYGANTSVIQNLEANIQENIPQLGSK